MRYQERHKSNEKTFIKIFIGVAIMHCHIYNFYLSSLNLLLFSGDFVIGVTAVDPDSGNNGRVVYRFLNTDIPFSLSPESGVITAAQKLSGGEKYSFQVLASDLVRKVTASIFV